MKYRKLGSTEMNVSVIGFGASVFNNFFLDSNFNNTDESIEKVKNIIKTAIDLGINYFDVAPWYGNAQYLLSVGLSQFDRNSYYLATKVGRYNSDRAQNEWFDFSYKRTLQSVEESLKLFNCDYIDLIQVHDFEFADNLDQIINETLPALNELRTQGKVKYIGLNSYLIEKIKEVLEVSSVKIDTILTFTHLTLDDTSLLEHIDYFKSKNVGIINSAPLSMGLYTETGAPSWNRAPAKVKEAVKEAFEYCKNRNINLTKLAIYFSAASHLDSVDLTIVSMSSERIVKENVSYLEELNENEKKVLNEIRNKFFVPLHYKGYGDDEVKSYRNKLKKLEFSN